MIPKDVRKHPLQMRVHHLFSRHPGWIITIVVFLTIYLAGLQFNTRFGVVLAAIDTAWIICTKWMFDRFFASRFFLRSFTFLNVCVIFLLVTGAVVVMTAIDFAACRLLTPDILPDIRHVHTVLRNGFWITGAFMTSLVLCTEKSLALQEELRSSKNDLEIKLLRSQIGPHFIFNALNNIYSLVYTHDAKAPEAILQLSDILRYTVDICQTDRVTVSQECGYIENYIAFQRLRMGGGVQITFDYDIQDDGAVVPPMLLQPFVENVFVHGDLTKAIRIVLQARDGSLLFSASNAQKRPGVLVKPRRNRNSIGIANVRQRLELYFPHAHELHIKEDEQHFEVSLKIRLD